MEQTEAQLRRQARDAALKAAGGYALVAFLWILLSDELVEWLFADAEIRSHFQTFKGLFFVAVTGIVLWVMMRRYFDSWQREILARKQAELAKGDSEARLQTVSNLARVGLVIVDQNHRYRYTNQSYRQILRIEREHLVGLSVAEVLGPLYEDQVRARLDRALAGERLRYELVVPQEPGASPRYYDVSYEPGTDASGRIVVVVVVDITERKQASEVIASQLELQRRLANIAATVPGMIYQFRRRPDGAFHFPFASEAIGSYFGITAAELEADASLVFARMHPDDYSRIQSDIEESARTLRPWLGEFRYRHPARGEIWMMGHSRPVREDDGGTLWTGFTMEITAHKVAELALQENEAKLRSIGDNLPGSYIYQFVRDAAGRGRYLYLSAGAANIHGESVADLLADESRMSRQVRPGHAAALASAIETSLHSMTDFDFDLEITRSDGERRWLNLHARPRWLANGDVVWDGVATDITASRRAEEALRFQEAVLEETGRIAKVGGWSFDPSTGKGMWTAEVARIHDLEPEEATSRDIGLGFYTEESRVRVEAAIRAAVEHGVAYDLQLELISAKGVRKWVRTIGHPVLQDGRVVQVRGSFQDITALHRMDEARERQQRRVALLGDISRRLVLNFSADGLLRGIFSDLARELDVDVYANYLYDPAKRRLRLDSAGGLTNEEVRNFAELQLGQSLCGLVAERQAPLVLPELAHVSLAQAQGIVAFGVQAYVGQPLLANGQLVGTISFGSRRRTSFTAADVQLIKAVADQVAAAVERNGLLRALQASEARFRSVVENIGEVFWLSDVGKSSVEYVSPSFETVWGRSCDSLRASMAIWKDSIHPQDRDRVLAAARTKQVLGLYDETYRIIRPDGSTRWVRDKAFPILGPDGGVERLVGVAVDVTEARNMEEKFLRAQRMEAIGTLASGIAHDLNNILAPMLMVTGLFRDKLTTAQDQTMLAMIERSARRGAGIIGQLLTFSRGLEGAKAALQPRLLLREIAHLMSETLPRDIDVRLEAPSDLAMVTADATQLHQVLLNFCINARDAMPNGGRLVLRGTNVQLDEAATRHFAPAKPGAFVMLSVRDSGTGIPPEIITRIFDPFFTTKEIGKGTGLGLATVMGIVRGHHGVVTVESEPGIGTEFRVYLPISETPESQAPQASRSPEIRGNGELILLVDDEEVIRHATARVLEASGYRVVTVANGEEAVQAFTARRGSVSLVVTDVMMPVMDGMTLARALHVLEPALPIIACSGLDQQDRRAEFARHGVVAVLNKPLSVPTLLEAVHGALAARTAPGAAGAGRV